MDSPHQENPSQLRIRDLKPLQDTAHAAVRPELQQLNDAELLESVLAPRNADGLVINSRTGMLSDGNGRAWELIRRSGDPNSAIAPDTLVPVEYYEPDLSMFPDLE